MLAKPILNKLQKYFKGKTNILAVYLYGSFANGLPNKMSDIDFGIVLQKPVDESKVSNLRLKYASDINDIVKPYILVQYVDIVILGNDIPPLLKLQIIYFGKLIFSRNDDQRIKLEVKFFREYEETSYLRAVQNKYLVKRIKEGKFGIMPKLKGLT